jgi:hypothetical protein
MISSTIGPVCDDSVNAGEGDRCAVVEAWGVECGTIDVEGISDGPLNWPIAAIGNLRRSPLEREPEAAIVDGTMSRGVSDPEDEDAMRSRRVGLASGSVIWENINPSYLRKHQSKWCVRETMVLTSTEGECSWTPRREGNVIESAAGLIVKSIGYETVNISLMFKSYLVEGLMYLFEVFEGSPAQFLKIVHYVEFGTCGEASGLVFVCKLLVQAEFFVTSEQFTTRITKVAFMVVSLDWITSLYVNNRPQ